MMMMMVYALRKIIKLIFYFIGKRFFMTIIIYKYNNFIKYIHSNIIDAFFYFNNCPVRQTKSIFYLCNDGRPFFFILQISTFNIFFKFKNK